MTPKPTLLDQVVLTMMGRGLSAVGLVLVAAAVAGLVWDNSILWRVVGWAFKLFGALVSFRVGAFTFLSTRTPRRTAVRAAAWVVGIAGFAALTKGYAADTDCDSDLLYGSCSGDWEPVAAEQRLQAATLVLALVGVPVALAGLWANNQSLDPPVARSPTEDLTLKELRSWVTSWVAVGPILVTLLALVAVLFALLFYLLP